MPNPVVHWEILASDPKKLQGFYAQLFGWHIDANNPMNYGITDTHSDAGINGGIAPRAGSGYYRVTFYIQVDDLQASLNKAERLGGKTVMPPIEIPNVVTFAHFSDPEGNIIGLVKE